MCREKHCKSSSWLVNSVRWFVVYEHVNTYTIESFVGLCTHSNVWKVSSANTGECVTTGGLYRPTHLCVAHFELHKKTFQRFFWCGKVGGVWGGDHTIQSAVPLPLCSAFHRCCWWDLPLMCHRQTWWCGFYNVDKLHNLCCVTLLQYLCMLISDYMGTITIICPCVMLH